MTSGFGITVDWDWDKNEIPTGYSMPFMRALTTATEGLFLLVTLPRLLLSHTKWGREAIRGNYEMEVSRLSTVHNYMALT